MVNVVAFNGSPRKNGNTALLLRRCLNILEEEGLETKFVQVGGSNIHGCRACLACRKRELSHCVMDDDPLNLWLDDMQKADAILLGSPTYFWSVSAEMKALMERAGLVARGALRRGEARGMFFGKVGAALTSYYRSGSVHTIECMHAFFHATQMIVPGNIYWAQAQDVSNGQDMRAVAMDADGLRYVDELGRSVAWLVKKLHAGEPEAIWS